MGAGEVTGRIDGDPPLLVFGVGGLGMPACGRANRGGSEDDASRATPPQDAACPPSPQVPRDMALTAVLGPTPPSCMAGGGDVPSARHGTFWDIVRHGHSRG